MRVRLVFPAALLVAVAYVKGRQHSQVPRPSRIVPPGCDLSDDARRRAEAEAADARELAGERVVGWARAEVAAVAAPPAPAPLPAREVGEWDVPEFPFHAATPPRSGPVAAPVPAPQPQDAAEPEAPAGPEAPAESVSEAVAVPVAEPQPRAAAVVAPIDAEPTPGSLSEWSAPVAPATAASPAPDAPVAEIRVDESGRFSLGGWAAQAGHMALVGVTLRDRRARALAPGDIRLVPEALVNVADGGLVVMADEGFAPDAEGFTVLVAAAAPGSFAVTGRYEVIGG